MAVALDQAADARTRKGDYPFLKFVPGDFVPLEGYFKVVHIEEKVNGKYTQHECLRIFCNITGHRLPIEQDELLLYFDLYKGVRSWDNDKKQFIVNPDDHGQYLFDQTLANLEPGKTYAGKFKARKNLAEYTELPWSVVEETDATKDVAIPSETGNGKGYSGKSVQSQAEVIADRLTYAVQLFNLENPEGLLEYLVTIYQDIKVAHDKILDLIK